jgi:hypothetical protein
MGAFRRGLIIGAAVGYVQGAKAGRSRYEAINTKLEKLGVNSMIQKATDTAVSLVGSGMNSGKDALDGVLVKAGGLKKELFGGSAGSSSSPNGSS